MHDASLISKIVSVGHWQAEYLVFGHGQEILLAFHGFDNDAKDLMVFEPSLGDRYTIISVNLFYHGSSRCAGKADDVRFTPEQLKALIEKLLIECKVNRFSLLGYSLGGRICLQLLSLFTERIERLLLLAADGLISNGWYKFLTGSLPGKMIFRGAVQHPQLFLRTAALLRQLKLVGEKQYKFALSYFDAPDKREKVYNVWMVYRHILPDPKKAAMIIKDSGLACHLLFGKRDAIIPVAHSKLFAASAGKTCEIHLLDTGHQLIKPEVGKYIRENCLK